MFAVCRWAKSRFGCCTVCASNEIATCEVSDFLRLGAFAIFDDTVKLLTGSDASARARMTGTKLVDEESIGFTVRWASADKAKGSSAVVFVILLGNGSAELRRGIFETLIVLQEASLNFLSDIVEFYATRMLERSRKFEHVQ